MFEFFKDTLNEYRGIDIQKVKEERRKKQEQEREERFIFSRKSKVIIVTIGVLYLVMAFLVISIYKSHANAVGTIVVYSVLSVIDIGTIISIIVGKRTGEIIGLVGVIAFMLLLFFSTAFM